MKRFKLFLLLALMSVPFMQSCNKPVDKPDQVALATLHSAPFSAAGFYGLLDNGDMIYPSSIRVQYEPKAEPVRAILYFKELEEPVQGFKYNADIHSITELLTQNIKTVNTAAADTLKDGVEIINAYIGGGYLNIEFKAYIDPYNTKQEVTVELQDMRTDGIPEWDSYYPLTLGFRCYPTLVDGMGYEVSSIACFYIGDEYSLENLGCEGYELRYKGLMKVEGDNSYETKIVKPE